MLSCRNLRLRYGSVVALDGLSLDVAPGRMTGFVGPNGAGKTSTMRIILGVLGADDGEVRWHGAPLDAGIRRHFGYMPEERGLYPKMRVRDQLVFYARLHGLDAVAARAAADDLLERLGLADRAGDTVETLSLGNQQRVQLAAALVHRPDLLVLDEPFSGLDPIGVDVLSAVLREEVARGVPVLFSSHQLELVERLCDDVAIIKDGRIVAAGTVDELRRRGTRRIVRVAIAGVDGAGAGEGGVGGLPAWIDGVAGVEPVGDDDGALLLALADGTDGQAVLDRARAAGEVTHFSYVLPTLTELFRAVVTPDAETTDAEASRRVKSAGTAGRAEGDRGRR